jgi:hypothetical protein
MAGILIPKTYEEVLAEEERELAEFQAALLTPAKKEEVKKKAERGEDELSGEDEEILDALELRNKCNKVVCYHEDCRQGAVYDEEKKAWRCSDKDNEGKDCGFYELVDWPEQRPWVMGSCCRHRHYANRVKNRKNDRFGQWFWADNSYLKTNKKSQSCGPKFAFVSPDAHVRPPNGENRT